MTNGHLIVAVLTSPKIYVWSINEKNIQIFQPQTDIFKPFKGKILLIFLLFLTVFCFLSVIVHINLFKVRSTFLLVIAYYTTCNIYPDSSQNTTKPKSCSTGQSPSLFFLYILVYFFCVYQDL